MQVVKVTGYYEQNLRVKFLSELHKQFRTPQTETANYKENEKDELENSTMYLYLAYTHSSVD